MVDKITIPPSQKGVIDKINEVIDNLGGGGSAPVWGNITGTLSNQTDLQSALNAKYDASNPNGYTSNVGTVTSVNSTSPDANGNVTISIPSTSDLANKDLSNLSSTGEAKFQKPLTNDQLCWYGTCDTAAATRNKVVVCTGFTLVTGVSIKVKFTNAQTYNGACRLNVNGTGNVSVYSKDGTASVRYCWLEGEVVSFTYDGTYWIMDDAGIATTTYYGYTKLSSSLTSTSTALAATPSTINGAMQNIVTGYPIYSATSAYAVGDRVRYSSKMYECNTAIGDEGETWDATHWTELDPVMTQLDGKADVDLSNINNTAKIAIAHNSMPSTTKYTDLVIANNTTYQAPADGYFVIYMSNNTVAGNNSGVQLFNTTTGIGYSYFGYTDSVYAQEYRGFVSCKKGEYVYLKFARSANYDQSFKFIYAVGSESEAS